MWQMCKDAVFYCIEFFYNFCGDWGLAILLITIIFRLLMTPLMHKQAKSSYMTQKLQPRIEKINEQFANDPARRAEETQKIYAEAQFNPLAGCVPMLIQMPIFIALFQVLRELELYMTDPSNYCFYNIIDDLVMTPSQAFDAGFGAFVPYLILLLVFALATFLPMVIQQFTSQNSQQRTMMLVMGIVMTVMMLWIGWSSPAGVLLFWGASSVIGIIQNQVSRAICKKNDKEEEEIKFELAGKPVEVDVTRKVQKKRNKKKNTSKRKK